MTPSRMFRLALVIALVVAAVIFSRRCGAPQSEADAVPQNGGKLVATYRTEPTHFNRLVEARPMARLTALLTQATLLRVDPNTGALVPRLATEWTGTPDGLTWTVTLRRGICFSDGTAFTASDVLFTFQAIYDERVKSPLALDMRAKGQSFQLRAIDDHHIVLTFPSPFGQGLAILDSVPILPRHKLQAALDAGTFRDAWSASANLSDMAGLGPFMLQAYAPAQHLRFVRNPHFWRTDATGQKLPYLDELEVQIVPEQNAELLRLQSGTSDLTNGGARAEDLAMLRDAETAGRVTLVDVGPAIDVSTLWFNLTPGSKAVADKPWLAQEAFRRAISHAVNRQAIVDTVHLGAAAVVYGPVSPGHGDWFVPDLGATPFDLARARTLLTSLGLQDRNGDGVLDDASNRPVEFSLLTQSGHTERERTSTLVGEQLRQVGIKVNVVPMDQRVVQARYASGDYEGIYYGAQANSKDPTGSRAFWLSNGPMHFWNPNQPTAGSEWEGRIDALMLQLAETMDHAERKRQFTEAQQLLADHVPALWFAAPHVSVPMSMRVGGATPTVIQPPVLWNAEELFVLGPRR